MTAKSIKNYRLFPKSRKSKSGKATTIYQQYGSYSFSYGTSEVTSKSKSEKITVSYHHYDYGSFSLSYGTSDDTDIRVRDFQVPTFPVIEDLTTPTIIDAVSKTIVDYTTSTSLATPEDEETVSSTTTKVVSISTDESTSSPTVPSAKEEGMVSSTTSVVSTSTSTTTVPTKLLVGDTMTTIFTIDEFLPPTTYGNLTAVDSTSLNGDTQVNETIIAEISPPEIEEGWNKTAGAVGISITALVLLSVAVAAYLKFSRRRRDELPH